MAKEVVVTKVPKAQFDALSGAYMFVVENWAVSAREVARVRTAGDVKKANALLNKLAWAGLIEGTHVNNEREVTWQSYYDIENSDAAETLASAKADFNAQFAVGRGKVAPVRAGGSGPRYTLEQIATGVKATRAGMSAVVAAAEAGVKSPSYFRNVCKARIAELDAVKAPARKRSKAGLLDASDPRQVSRKSAKARGVKAAGR